MIELIIFAVIAGLLIARLNSVLGQKNEGDEFRGSHTFKRDNNTPRDAKGGERDNVITLPGYDNPSQAVLNTGDDDLPVSVNEQLKRIHMIDGQFDEDHFTSGVRVAFPMIVEAFAANDKDTLSTLLDDNIYQDFAAAIDDRAEANETLSTEIKEVHDISIIEAKTNNNMLEITVRKSFMEWCVCDSDSDNVRENVACRPVAHASREEFTCVIGQRVREGIRAPAELHSNAGPDHDSAPLTLSHSWSDCAHKDVIRESTDGQRLFKLR